MSSRIALVGAGYWGRNLFRVLERRLGPEGLIVIDQDAAVLRQVVAGRVPVSTEFEEALREGVDAVVLATPPSTHYEMAGAVIDAGKHVFVEKPLALDSTEALDLVDRASAQSVHLMVGHTFLFNDAYNALRDVVKAGDIGEIHYAVSERLNLGIVSPGADAWWDLAPHDLSMLVRLFGEGPERVTVRSGAFIYDQHPEVVFATMGMPGDRLAHVYVSRLHPAKTRRMTVVGSEGMAVYDDVSADAKLKIYDKSVQLNPADSFGEFTLQQRWGDAVERRIDFREPLGVEMNHFLAVIAGEEVSISDGEFGVEIVKILEAGDRSWRSNQTVSMEES